MRRVSRTIKIGDVAVGGENPIVVQSMTCTDTRDISATVSQIHALTSVGCKLVRVAVPDQQAAQAIKLIKPQVTIPLIADIHFDHRLALSAIASGVDALRINPGNIGSAMKVKELVAACKDRCIPIRIGVNGGSLKKEWLHRYHGITAAAMVESALEQIKVLEEVGFHQIKVSLKASSVSLTVEAYEEMAKRVDYPLHLGVTEAGTAERAMIKSAMAFGMLLRNGIGDTIRVSITGNPLDEVWAAYEILRSLELSSYGAELISCPTCGRCEIDLTILAEAVDKHLRTISAPIKVAVMGCVVNGPGEAKEADIGVAGGRGQGLLFHRGEIIKKVKAEELLPELIQAIDQLAIEKGGKLD